MSSRQFRSSRDAVLSELNQKKKDLEKSRLRVVAELERIDNNLEEIQAEYAKIFNDPSSLLKLPTEVTCMIFDFSAENQSPNDYYAENKSFLPEVVISHVCKRWRDVSLTYPQLWKRFFFRAENVESMSNSLDRFDLYIERSGSQNLELYLDFVEEYRHETPIPPIQLGERLEMVRMAVNQLERWKIVTLISMNDLDVESRFHNLRLASAPNLEYFAFFPVSPCEIGDVVARDRINISDPEIFRGGAPKLRYFLFDCSNRTLPPLSNITTLRLEAPQGYGWHQTIHSWETFFAILTMPSLAHLSLIGNICAAPRPVRLKDSNLINMNNLRHLRYSDYELMTFLLPFLRAPLLETLVICNDEGIRDDDDGLGTNTFGDEPAEAYSFPALQTLTLVRVAFNSAESAWRIVQMSKNISSLFFSHHRSDRAFFTALHLHDGPISRCWPMLFTITADFDSCDDIDVIVDFVRSRSCPKKLFTLRLFEETYVSWKNEFCAEFAEIETSCTVEVLGPKEEAETVLRRPMWPPGVDCPDYAFSRDPFENNDIPYWSS